MQGKSAPEAGAEEAVYVGIDVCKARLDVYLHPTGQSFRVANSKEGIKALCCKLAGAKVVLVVMEATGKLHRLAHRMLGQARCRVAAVNPARPRKLAEAMGQLAKTDKIDARLLALFGACLGPKVTPVPAQTLGELQELAQARQAAKDSETAPLPSYGCREPGSQAGLGASAQGLRAGDRGAGRGHRGSARTRSCP